MLDKKVSALLCMLIVACSPMVYTHGVPNLVQVDTNLWRSGQITTQAGWDYIATLAHGQPVHVIKLNFPNEGSDEPAVKMGFNVIEVPLQPEGDTDVLDDVSGLFEKPDASLVAGVEWLLSHRAPGEFWLVHCTHGQDRTGFIIGAYRVLTDRWPKRQAYAEMLAHHFHREIVGLVEAWIAVPAPSAGDLHP